MLVLNRNQNLLGKLLIVLRRHEEILTNVTTSEWVDLHTQIGRATSALQSVFAPTHFNYVFLQNQDRHVHLHVVPRYDTPRRAVGLSFTDAAYPDHYIVDETRILEPTRLDEIAVMLRSVLP